MKRKSHKQLFPLGVKARINELRELKDGWFDGDGLAPYPGGLDWLEETIPKDIPEPLIFPTVGGGVQLEWFIEPVDITMEIDLITKSGGWSCFDLKTFLSETEMLELDTADAWNWIAKRLIQIQKGVSAA